MAKVRSVSFFVSSFLDLVSTCFGACSASTHFALVLFPGRWCLVSACWLGRSNHKQVQVSRQEGRGGKGIVCIFFFLGLLISVSHCLVWIPRQSSHSSWHACFRLCFGACFGICLGIGRLA